MNYSFEVVILVVKVSSHRWLIISLQSISRLGKAKIEIINVNQGPAFAV